MKLHLAAAALVFCSFAGICSASILNPIDGFDAVKLYRGVGSTGGIFHVDLNPSGPLSLDFDTFCIQTLETIAFDTKYAVYSVSKKTVGSFQNGLSLSSYAAWLYSGFLGLDDDMNLSLFTGTGFNPGTLLHVNALQAGIWLSMGYALPGGFSYSPTMLNALNTAFSLDSEWAALTPDTNGIITGNIHILNLVTMMADNLTIKSHHQDQLIYIPPPPGPPPGVPEPVSFFVWSMLAMCVGSLGLRSRD